MKSSNVLSQTCVLKHTLIKLNLQSSLYTYAQVWYLNKKNMLINTGLIIDTNDIDKINALRPFPYSYTPLNYKEVFAEIKDNGDYTTQIITAVEVYVPVIVKDILGYLDSDRVSLNQELQVVNVNTNEVFTCVGFHDGRLAIVKGANDK